MNILNKTISLCFASIIGCSVLTAQTTVWTGEHSSDRFSFNNWSDDVPTEGMTGIINDARVEIGTAAEMNTGATVNFNGNSLLERNFISNAQFTGVLNINDTTNVNITEWRAVQDATLNWNSSGTFAIAPSGSSSNPRFLIDRNAHNAVVNVHSGFWDLRGNTHVDAIQIDAGTFNMHGGLLITDNRFKVGRGDQPGAVNYYADAEIRAASMGTFHDSVFNFELGATLFLESGLLESFGQEGFEWLRDEMRKGSDSSIHINGIHQSLGPTDDLSLANFMLDTVELDGIWYNSMTAIPEPKVYALLAGCLAMLVVIRKRLYSIKK